MPIAITCPQGHNFPLTDSATLAPGEQVVCPVCGVAIPVNGSDTATLPPTAAVAAPERADVPGYEILDELGRGGMGVVYQARHIGLNRIVALKMILAGGHAGPDELARFRGEAEAVARLRHPNVVQIYDVGESSGLPYFSLEYIEGGSLDRKLAGTPLPPKDAAALVETLARAMAAAHAAGLVHRDLKPGNVLLATDGTPKVTDFGLAKKLDAAGLTATGAVMGTPSYMAPEQAGGKAALIGPACDVYALGAILYECLTGRPPFKAATPLDTMMQVVSDEPVPPSQLQSQTPRDLETICLKCLQKEPARRYASAQELADDLRRFQQGEPIRARPVGWLERTRKWAGRRPAAAALIVVSVLAVLAIVGVFGVAAVVVYDANRNLALANIDLAKERDNSSKAAQAALEMEANAVAQLNRSRRLLMTSQLLRAGSLIESDPVEAHALLDNEDACPPDLRDFCWRYLRSRGSRDTVVWQGESATVTALAMGANDTLLAWGTAEGTLTLWDRTANAVRATIKGHERPVWNLAFSADGQTLTSVGADSAVKRWDATKLTEQSRHKVELGRVRSVAFSVDRKIMATGYNEQRVILWDPATGEQRESLGKVNGDVTALAISPDGHLLAVGLSKGLGSPAEVILRDLTTRSERARIVVDPPCLNDLAFSPDGKALAVATASLQIIDVTAVRPQIVATVSTLRSGGSVGLGKDGMFTGDVGVLAFAPNGKTLAHGRHDTIELVDTASWKSRQVLRGHAGFVRSLAWSGDGSMLAASGTVGRAKSDLLSPPKTHEVRLWQLGASDKRHPLETQGYWGFAFTPDGKTIALGQKDGRVALCDPTNGTILRSFKVADEPIVPFTFSADGTRLLALNGGSNAIVYDVFAGQPLTSFASPKYVFALSPDGKLAAGGEQERAKTADAGGDQAGYKLWDASTGQELAKLTSELRDPRSVAFSPDGSLLAIGDATGDVHLWDVASREERRTLATHAKVLRALRFSPDGKALALVDDQGSVKVWEIDSGRQRFALELHDGAVFAVAFSRDGQDFAVSGSTAVTIWDAVTGQLRLTLEADNTGMLAFSPDGSLLLLWTRKGDAHPLRVWQAPKP